MREKGARRDGVVGRERQSGAQDMQTRRVLENLPLPFRISFLRAGSVRAYSPRRFTGEERRPRPILQSTYHSRLAAAVLIALLRCDASTQRRRARARARSSARSQCPKHKPRGIPRLGLAWPDSPWRGLAWRCFDRSPLFRRRTALRTCYEKCRRNYTYGDSLSDSWNITLWTSLNL